VVAEQLTKIISGDSHLEIDSKWWIERVPKKYRDRAPHVIHLADAGDAWMHEGANLEVSEMEVARVTSGGRPRAEWRPWGSHYEGAAGSGSAEQRIKEQDQDGIHGEVMFPGNCGPRKWDLIGSRDAYRAVLRAFNSYVAEEYCAYAPDRLFGLGSIASTGVDDAIAELQWCKEAGLKGIVLSVFPNGSGMPKAEDDRFWAAALDLDMPITAHVQIIHRGVGMGKWIEYPEANARRMAAIATIDVVDECTRFARPSGINAMQFAMSGVFDRFPDLQIFFAEAMIGWIPYFMENADDRYDMLVPWVEDAYGWNPVKHRPSDYIKNNCYWSFGRDRTGVVNREVMGVDRLVWATDFPHYETDWPASLSVIERNFEGVPLDEVEKMTSGNIAKFLRLDV